LGAVAALAKDVLGAIAAAPLLAALVMRLKAVFAKAIALLLTCLIGCCKLDAKEDLFDVFFILTLYVSR